MKIYYESTDGIILGTNEAEAREALKGIQELRSYATLKSVEVDQELPEATHISNYYD